MRPIEERLEEARRIRDLEYRELLSVGVGLDALTVRTDRYERGWDGDDRTDPGLEPWRAYLRQYEAWLGAVAIVDELEADLLLEELWGRMVVSRERRLDRMALDLRESVDEGDPRV